MFYFIIEKSHTHTHIHTHTYTHTHTHTYIYIYIHIYISLTVTKINFSTDKYNVIYLVHSSRLHKNYPKFLFFVCLFFSLGDTFYEVGGHSLSTFNLSWSLSRTDVVVTLRVNSGKYLLSKNRAFLKWTFSSLTGDVMDKFNDQRPSKVLDVQLKKKLIKDNHFTYLLEGGGNWSTSYSRGSQPYTSAISLHKEK